ncbi:MAG: hypothetical protein E7582_04765 [Ruminococcaceae bacterium]|nr:hypothetical protein [Oscillospiraceae bacterium]
MKQYEYIHPIDEMERITRKDFCEKFDEILDRVSEENIGFVITDSESNDVVLCPAHWLTFPLDNDFGCIINSAVRYAIGRHTYMPSVACDFVRKYINILDERTVEVMIEDIDKELKLGIAQEELWVGLRNELIDRKKHMKKWEASQSE